MIPKNSFKKTEYISESLCPQKEILLKKVFKIQVLNLYFSA